jgi:hypothetical protein
MKVGSVLAIAVIVVALVGVLLTKTHRAHTDAPHTSADTVPAGMMRYQNPAYGFSLIIPETMDVSSFDEPGAAQTVRFETPGSDPPLDFQLYIIPYAPGTITSSQIAKDTHGTATGTPQEVVLGSGVHGLIFTSTHPVMGAMREVWFLRNDHLIEATTYAGNDTWLAGILNTLELDE